MTVERMITYVYGEDDEYWGYVNGKYAWEQLKEQIEDNLWGGPYKIVSAGERSTPSSKWVEVDVP